jgi:hypothetical protein
MLYVIDGDVKSRGILDEVDRFRSDKEGDQLSYIEQVEQLAVGGLGQHFECRQ